MTATLFPSGFGEIEVRFGPSRPAHSVYVRRRLLVGLLLLALVALVGIGASTVLADRGGVPASTLAIRPATSPAAAAGTAMPAAAQPVAAAPVVPAPGAASTVLSYVVQPGDTMWSLAQRFHGGHSMTSYVDAMVKANGGATLRAGQTLILP